MTNHSETTGPFENGDIAYDGSAAVHQVTLRTPAELADALPYLLGYRPEDSIVLVALNDRGGRGRFGGRARLGIPASSDDWPFAARQLAHGLITGSERRGAKPGQMVAFLCQEPAAGESGRDVVRRLEPLAQKLRTECGLLDVPVIEALCISGGRFWSYCCPTDGCCPDDGLPMGLPGTSVLAAAAAYAGVQVRGSLRELRARLLPWETAAALEQEIALDTAGLSLVPRILDEAERVSVAEETLGLAERVMTRFAEAPFVSGAARADLHDDQLLDHEEAASLILGLQDRTTRDRAAEWMEGDEAGPALRLWRALARRCVGPYGEHAAAPLTLAGWVAWSAGDQLEAREALAMALGADPDYLFARLLHQACNEGLDPESVRRCLRAERRGRTRPTAADVGAVAEVAGAASVGTEAAQGEPAGRGDAITAITAPPGDAGDVEDIATPGDVATAVTADAGDAVVPHGASGTGGSAASGAPAPASRRGRRTRVEGPVPAGSRPATSRTDGPCPGPARASGRPGTRTSGRGGSRRRGAGRPGADRGSGASEKRP
ncbi:DUF4192 domain-containing protein [Streptomyces sp. NPDC088816]|uniref:DUF4192 domain-containing protein n=1 Tax=Streptomyces sp. NPDC088816 TaxID=3365906 RepID=UPI0038245254